MKWAKLGLVVLAAFGMTISEALPQFSPTGLQTAINEVNWTGLKTVSGPQVQYLFNYIAELFQSGFSGFVPISPGARMTPFPVTTADSSGPIPLGSLSSPTQVIVVSNVGANPMFCNVAGIPATVADQPISASNGWFAFGLPVGASVLHCIATGGSTVADGLAGAGTATGTGGGGGGGGSGGSVTQGTIPWADNIVGWGGVSLGLATAYGTAPTGNVPGVNAFVTNTITCANCSGTGAAATDDSTFTYQTSIFAPSGGFFQTGPATSNPVANGKQGMSQMTAFRAVHQNLRDSSGNEEGVSSNPLVVGGVGSNGSSGVAVNSTNLPAIVFNYGFNGTTWDQLQVDGGKNLKINCVTGCSSTGGSSIADNAAFTAGTTSFTVTGGLYQSSISNLTSGHAGAAALTIDRNVFVNVAKLAGTALGGPSNYGTSPGAVAVPGVNANVTNTVAVSGAGGTFPVIGSTSNASSAVPTSSTNLPTIAFNYGFNGTSWDQLQVDGNKSLEVNCITGCSGGGGGGSSIADNGAFTAGTTNITAVGGLYQASITNLTSGHAGAAALTIDRNVFVNLNKLDGTVLGAPSNYGTSPGAVIVPGVNAFVTNTPAVTCALCATDAHLTNVQGPAGTPTTTAVTVQGNGSGTAIPVADGTVVGAINGAIVPVPLPVVGQTGVVPTDCSGTITVGGTAQAAFTAQTTLHGFTLANIDAAAGSGEPVWYSTTGTATAATAGSFPLPPPAATTFAGGGKYDSPLGFGIGNALSVIAATTGHKFSCTWW